MKYIVLIIRKFQSRTGNRIHYFSVEIYIDGEKVANVPPTQYIGVDPHEVACKKLEKMGRINPPRRLASLAAPGEWQSIFSWGRQHKVDVIDSVSIVRNKKDL